MKSAKLIQKMTESKEIVNTAILAIIELQKEVKSLEAKNRRLEEAREKANAVCAKWEGLYKAEVTKRETLEKMVKEYQEVIIPGYRNIAEKSGGMPMPEQQKAKEGMRMERITSNRTWEEAQYNLANEKGYSSIWLRLNMIEDILGEDYDLERLRELVEADRNGRCVVLTEGGHSDKDGENALKAAMRVVSFYNDPVTRYIVEAVAEKLATQAAETELKDVERVNPTSERD